MEGHGGGFWNFVISAAALVTILGSCGFVMWFAFQLDERLSKLERPEDSPSAEGTIQPPSPVEQEQPPSLPGSEEPPARQAPVDDLPSGTMLPYFKYDADAGIPDGWVRCGEAGTPTTDGRLLIGTVRTSLVGEPVEPETHRHQVNLRTQFARGPADQTPNSIRGTSKESPPHMHFVEGFTKSVESSPGSLQVMFLCKP